MRDALTFLTNLRMLDEEQLKIRGSVTQEGLTTSGRRILFRGETLQMFEYRDDAAARADVARFAKDAGTVDGKVLTWTSSPHLFHKGRITVVYEGGSESTLQMLELLMGKQAAGL